MSLAVSKALRRLGKGIRHRDLPVNNHHNNSVGQRFGEVGDEVNHQVGP